MRLCFRPLRVLRMWWLVVSVWTASAVARDLALWSVSSSAVAMDVNELLSTPLWPMLTVWTVMLRQPAARRTGTKASVSCLVLSCAIIVLVEFV